MSHISYLQSVGPCTAGRFLLHHLRWKQNLIELFFKNRVVVLGAARKKSHESEWFGVT